MKPDMVIIQVQMPFEKTREALDRICAVEPSPKVMIVAMFEGPAPFVLFEAGDQRLRAQECFTEAARRRGSSCGLRLSHERR
jgi:hypothetical protein